MTIKVKHLVADFPSPKAVPDGNSLEEIVNAYLAPLNPTNVLNVIYEREGSQYAARVIYQS